MFFLSSNKIDEIKYYYYKHHIFYDVQKDHSYRFKNENEITQKKVKKLQNNLNENEYIYKVFYRDSQPLYSISKNEKLFFDKKGKIIAIIYNLSNDYIRYTYYDIDGLYNIDCNCISKNCQLYYEFYKQPYIAQKIVKSSDIKYKDKKRFYIFHDTKNITYNIVCNITERMCEIKLPAS